MNTPMTYDQAIALLRKQPATYDTPDKLRALAAQVDADATGQTTVLYSGPSAKGVSSSNIIKSMLEAGEDIRVIDNSDAARLLQSREFLSAVAKAHGLDDFRPLASGTYRGPATDWLYHPTQGPWADASARFADATVGEVRAIVGDADPKRVFGATEVPHILANEKVPTIEGISREALTARQSTHGTQAAFEMIVARSREHVALLRVSSDVPVNHAGELLRDGQGQLKLDSRAYFSATNIESKTPTFSGETHALAGNMNPPSEYARAGQLHLHALRSQGVQLHGPHASGAAVKGLGAAGVAITAYDAADTLRDASHLHAQGNATAAQARIERFATQNVGGWAGAATFAGIGAAAGVESGPGLLITGAVGGIVGAVAGDKVADWLDERKINRQQDAQGHAWIFDPKRPEQGWGREIPPLPGTPQGQRLTADAALSDRLTFQASQKSIELALGALPHNRDPYRLAVNAAEQAQRQPFETGRAWIRDPNNGQWQQEIKTVIDGRIPVTRHEPASPARAMELERQSHALIADNAANTPAAMAARYRNAHEQNGWSRHGALPDAVSDALHHPGRIVGSDGNRYERDARGQWTHDGLLWDSTANGNLQRELEATYQQQQRLLNPPTLETVRVQAPQQSSRAAEPAPATPKQPQTVTPPTPEHLKDFRHPEHPQHSRYQGVLREVHRMEETNGIASGPHSERMAAAWVDRLGQEKGFALDRFEMRGQDVIALSRRDNYFDAQRELSLNADQALARQVEHVAADWAQRSMPHLGRPQTLESVSQLANHGLRHPDSSRQAQHERLREQVADTYAKAGILRNDTQLDRATWAVALDMQRHGLARADHLYLLPNRDGSIGPENGIGAIQGQYPLQLRSQTPTDAMQRQPEDSYQQLAQIMQQQAIEQQQRQAAVTQQAGPQLG